MIPPSSALTLEQAANELQALLDAVRTGVLATLGPDGPSASHVPFVTRGGFWRVYVHLSQLAQHAQHLQQERRIGFYVVEPDAPAKNPLALKRASLQGVARPLDRDDPLYAQAQEAYLARFKQAKLMFQLPDFQLWELALSSALFVGGFGRALRFTSGEVGGQG